MATESDRDRLVLILAFVGLMPAFAITGTLVKVHKERRRELAIEWAGRGARAVDQQRNGEAVEDFQTALAYEPGDVQMQRRLAEAFIAANRRTEARAQLLAQLDERPDDGLVNLDLARLSVADGDLPAAVRFYRAAIRGSWPSGTALVMRTAERELAALLAQTPAR